MGQNLHAAERANAAHQLYGLELEGHRHSDVALIMSTGRG
jgi:hypothetical protein